MPHIFSSGSRRRFRRSWRDVLTRPPSRSGSTPTLSVGCLRAYLCSSNAWEETWVTRVGERIKMGHGSPHYQSCYKIEVNRSKIQYFGLFQYLRRLWRHGSPPKILTLVSFQTGMTFLLLWKTKCDILKNTVNQKVIDFQWATHTHTHTHTHTNTHWGIYIRDVTINSIYDAILFTITWYDFLTFLFQNET